MPHLISNALKCVGGWGSAPDPTGGAYDAPSDPLIGRGFVPLALATHSFLAPNILLDSQSDIPRTATGTTPLWLGWLCPCIELVMFLIRTDSNCCTPHFLSLTLHIVALYGRHHTKMVILTGYLSSKRRLYVLSLTLLTWPILIHYRYL